MPSAATRRPIVVAGDITIDRLTWTEREASALTDPDTTDPNWQQQQQTHAVDRPGGALLLAEMLRHASPNHRVLSYDMAERLVPPPGDYLHSFIDLARRSKDDFAITGLRGFGGAGRSFPPVWDAEPPWMLVLDDAGNDFRKQSAVWRAALKSAAPEWVVLKMSRPLAQTDANGLWNELRPRDPSNPPPGVVCPAIDPQRLIVIVNADDLRHHGIQLTPGLSWERVAQDFVRNLGSVGKLGTLATCRHLVVRFGTEGAIHYRGYERGAVAVPRLYFDPGHMEGEQYPPRRGERAMIGLTAAFTAGLAAALVHHARNAAPDDQVDAAIKYGMRAARNLAKLGFRTGRPNGAPDYPYAAMFKPAPDDRIVRVDIPHEDIVSNREFSWRILEQGHVSELARRVAIHGPTKALPHVPLFQAEDLITADRREIENFQAIINLLKEYLRSNSSMPRPLSIAVFGPPGSGKSFVVEEIAASLRDDKDKPRGERHKPLEFNLAQFTSLQDLQEAFHLVRDRILTGAGTVPFVFFDEFDVTFEDQPGGWYKYLLAPMQDGKFRERAALHPLGRAVFVFAGGTAARYSDFIAPLSLAAGDPRRQQFVAAKGPDFVSRLRGHIDILGPSRIGGSDDEAFAVRRAILLRAGLKRRARQLFQSGDGQAIEDAELAIDDGVLHAFLTIPEFHHGARSLQAIIEMSKLETERRFTPSLLPPAVQLNLHVNAGEFLDLVAGETLPAELREQLGWRIHQKYRELQESKAKGNPAKLQELRSQPSMRPWHLLRADLRESNRAQADDIPRKLRPFDLCMAPLKPVKGESDGPIPELSREQIEVMAELEHERWVAERLRAGWAPGVRNIPRYTTPFLTPWKDLPDHTKENDINTVEIIPELLAEVGYGIYPLYRNP